MASLRAMLAGIAFILVISCDLGGVTQEAAGGGGWVRVGGECELPEDLSFGDEFGVSIGSLISQRGLIVGFADCNGRSAYGTSLQKSGCGWLGSITAHEWHGISAALRVEAATDLEARRWGGRR